MNAKRLLKNMSLDEDLITSLAKPLVSIIQSFYEDEKNMEDFEKWLSETKEEN